MFIDIMENLPSRQWSTETLVAGLELTKDIEALMKDPKVSETDLLKKIADSVFATKKLIHSRVGFHTTLSNKDALNE